MMNPSHPAPDLHQVIVEFADQGREFAVAIILQAEGSTPCQVGAKAVVEAGGRIHGTIGGGMIEAEAQRLAEDAIRTGRPVVFDFDLQGGVEVRLHPGVDRPLRLADGDGGVGAYLGREFFCFRFHPVHGDNPVDETQGQSFPGVDSLPGKDHFLGPHSSDDPGKGLSPPVSRDQAHAHFGETELGVLGGDDHVG